MVIMKTCNDCVCQEVCVYEKMMYEFTEKIHKRETYVKSSLMDDLDTLREMLAKSCKSYKKGNKND